MLANRLRFAKLKPSKLIVIIDNPLANVFIRQTFFHQTLENSRFAKHSARQTFPLYGSLLELACWCELDSLLNIFGLASTIDTQYTSDRLQLLSDPAGPVFENPTNSTCWNFQYKTFIKLCTKMHSIESL